jgi:hypothetical protein
MQTIAIPILALAAAAAPAQPAPETSVGLAVRSVPGGSVAYFNSPVEAQAACVAAGGGFGLEDGRWICANARASLQSTRATPPPAPLAPSSTPPAVQEPPGDLAVESLTLKPGESATFTLAPGFNHQLLRPAAPSAPGAITIRYEASREGSRVTASGGGGPAIGFRVLADPDGNGGFSPMGEMTIPAGGEAVTRTWPGSLGAISVGTFRPQ